MSYLKEHDEHIATEGFATFHVIIVNSFLGEISIEYCMTCGYEIVHCLHKVNTYINTEDMQLICNLCGEEGT